MNSPRVLHKQSTKIGAKTIGCRRLLSRKRAVTYISFSRIFRLSGVPPLKRFVTTQYERGREFVYVVATYKVAFSTTSLQFAWF